MGARTASRRWTTSVLCAALALHTAGSVQAVRAQEAAATRANDAAVAPAVPAASEPSTPEPSTPEPSASEPKAANAAREAALVHAVEQARREEQDSAVILPWVVAGVGVLTLTAGVVLGASGALSCDDSCGQSVLPPWLIVGGAGVTTVGTAWVILSRHDQAEARFRLKQAEAELERDRWQHAQHAQLGRTMRTSFSLRASF